MNAGIYPASSSYTTLQVLSGVASTTKPTCPHFYHFKKYFQLNKKRPQGGFLDSSSGEHVIVDDQIPR